MNLIKHQADDFYRVHDREQYKEFTQSLRYQLLEYRKDSHKLEFIEQIRDIVKQDYEAHLKKCKYKDDPEKCHENRDYENTLFFIQNEREDIIDNIPTTDFSQQEKQGIDESVEKLIKELDKVQLGQQITYDDLLAEIKELKNYYFLNKKTWSQLFIGRLSGMVASGVISETISKEIVEAVTRNYDAIIG